MIDTGKVDFQVYGLKIIPKEGGFLMYGNHQGMFDIVAIGATCDIPMAVPSIVLYLLFYLVMQK